MLGFDATKIKAATTNDVNNTKWEFIAQFIVDTRNFLNDDANCHNDYGIEILDTSYLTLNGDVDSDCYFSECVCNATPTDFLPTKITGHIDFKEDFPSGVYRLVYGVKCGSEKSWTDCGYEYDAWEEYDLISKYQFTPEEVDTCFDNKEDFFELDMDNTPPN